MSRENREFLGEVLKYIIISFKVSFKINSFKIPKMDFTMIILLAFSSFSYMRLNLIYNLSKI